MTVEQAKKLYLLMTPIGAAGVRIRFAHMRLAGIDADTAMVRAVMDER